MPADADIIVMEITVKDRSVKEKIREQLGHFFRSERARRPGGSPQLLRAEVAVEPLDPLTWLSAQPHALKTYWRDRELKFEVAGIGQADMLNGRSGVDDPSALFRRLTRYLNDEPGACRYYGGFRFRTRMLPDLRWVHFGTYYFAIPRFEIIRRGQRTYFACNYLWKPDQPGDPYQTCLNELMQVNWQIPEVPATRPTLVDRKDYPDKIRWKLNIQSALRLMNDRQVEKIVLARRADLTFQEDLDPLYLLGGIQQANARAFYFCFQPDHAHAFIGGTPERLYRRVGRKIFSEAVAGTRPRGMNESRDLAMQQELLQSEKDLREHRFVLDSIRQSFESVCETVDSSDRIAVLKLDKLQHLYATLTGILKPGIDDGQILSSLHPTPAVGGVPKAEAIREIDQLENFDRGWYAGPVGWVSRNAAEFAVAIRSGLVDANKLYLYSGAGIVPGSSPETEWEEIESKIANYLKVLGYAWVKR